MKKGLFLIVMFLIGIVATAQQNEKPEWFFNEDCKKIQDMISEIRKSPLDMNYELGELAQVHVNKWVNNKISYNIPNCKWQLAANGFTYEEVISMLLDNKDVADALLNTNERVGLYVLRRNFYGRDLFELCIIIPHESTGYYTKTVSTIKYCR